MLKHNCKQSYKTTVRNYEILVQGLGCDHLAMYLLVSFRTLRDTHTKLLQHGRRCQTNALLYSYVMSHSSPEKQILALCCYCLISVPQACYVVIPSYSGICTAFLSCAVVPRAQVKLGAEYQPSDTAVCACAAVTTYHMNANTACKTSFQNN